MSLCDESEDMTPQERKAFEVALEALEDLQLCTDDYYESSHEASKKGDKAITAIKEALQSNEQVEPAFWYSAQEDEFMTHKIRKEHERLNSYTHKVGKFDLPLYTHPPQPEQNPQRSGDINLSCKSTQARLATSWGYVKAQPLTDEEIEAIVLTSCVGEHGIGNTVARAIEKAHGIKEKNT